MKTLTTIRNCVPEFVFKCPKTWGSLTPTADPNVRSCEVCDRTVYYCASDGQTIQHAVAGNCIAREMPDGSELPPVFIGRPANPIIPTAQQTEASVWSHRECGIDDAIKNARDATRYCPDCGYPAPNWRVECRVCGSKFGRVPPIITD